LLSLAVNRILNAFSLAAKTTTTTTRARDTIEKIALKKTKTSEGEVQLRYAKALDFLDEYLDLVELPPTDSGHYEQEFDTLVGKSARLL
jgi:ribosomal protein L5